MQSETLAQEFARLVAEYRADTNGPADAEAWNLIADFAVENAAALSAALSIEQTQPVKVKALEWDEFSTTARRHFQSNTILGQFQVSYLGEFECWQLYSPQKSNSWKENFSRHASSEAAKAAAQQDYETRIRSAIIGMPTDIPTNLVERCAEILEWKKTGLLPGNALRALGKKINDDFGGSHFIDNGLGQAELRTIDEAFHLILALSTRTADRAEQDGSAISSKGNDHGA